MICLVWLLLYCWFTWCGWCGGNGSVGSVELKFEGFEQFLAMSVCIELLKRKLRQITNKRLFLLKYRS